MTPAARSQGPPDALLLGRLPRQAGRPSRARALPRAEAEAGLTFVGECLRGFGWVEIGYFPRLLGRSALLLLAACLLWL